MRPLLLALALTLTLTACEAQTSFDGGSGGSGSASAPVCHRIHHGQDCKTEVYDGVSVKTCTPKDECIPCGDVEGSICWWSKSGPPQPLKCVWTCP